MPKAPKSKVGQEKKPIHPNSRKAGYLSRQIARDQRVSTSKSVTSLKLEILAEKLLWFQENLDAEKKSYTKIDLADMVRLYQERFQDELEQIGIVRSVGNRKGLQHSSRENAIKMTLEKEKRELDEGVFEVPDILNNKHLEFFRAWKGEVKYVKNIKLKKMSLKDLDKTEHLGKNEMDTDESDCKGDNSDEDHV